MATNNPAANAGRPASWVFELAGTPTIDSVARNFGVRLLILAWMVTGFVLSGQPNASTVMQVLGWSMQLLLVAGAYWAERQIQAWMRQQDTAQARRTWDLFLVRQALYLGAGVLFGFGQASDSIWVPLAGGLCVVGAFGVQFVRMSRVSDAVRPKRKHPYADERSTPQELMLDAKRVTLFWVGLATAMTLLGLFIATRFSPLVLYHTRSLDAAAGITAFNACVAAHHGVMSCIPQAWEFWTEIVLFGGLGLLGFGISSKPWAKRLTMAGWLLFAFYWALVAQDLLIGENQDYVNFAFALIGTYFFTYLAYHQWLSEIRATENRTIHFLNVSTFVAAGAYFIIDKIEPVRTWLILAVSQQTQTTLGFFGQGSAKGLVYLTDVSDPESPTSFFYSTHFCSPVHPIKVVADWCAAHNLNVSSMPVPPHNLWERILQFNPSGEPMTVIPVSVILACTALQSIMLFVGLFMGTQAPMKRKVIASIIVAIVVYALNLIRNTGIIWFYGQGITSFWVIHDAVGKGGSLLAMIGIAFASFAWFPEFLRELIGVLDLPHRDGPVERTLRIGRRRPEPEPVVS